MTRAKKLLILIGSSKAVDIAVRNSRKRLRFSNLIKRLQELKNGK
jgi:ATP-dependent exoDNAse (exonuclease V) alpha subunit